MMTKLGFRILVGLLGLGPPLAGAQAQPQVADDPAIGIWVSETTSTPGLHGELEDGVYLSVNLSPRTLESELFHPSELTRKPK